MRYAERKARGVWRIANGILLTLFLGLVFAPQAHAQSRGFVSVVNPVRGGEFWQLQGQKPITSVTESYQAIVANGLPATWLVRFDAMADPSLVTALRTMDAKQERGIFLEITPSLAQAAGVKYNTGQTWHAAGSVFVTGYAPQDRTKLIDALVTKFRDTFGVLPKSVGAWWIDAYSLQYLKNTYDISQAMIVADQYSTDNYQVWGQYWSSPYYPSAVNALLPAQTPDKKLDVVITQWATRDPYNAYGNGVFDSTYSVQANDYIPYHDLGIEYFKKLLAVYLAPIDASVGHVTVGIENDFSWAQFGGEYTKQLSHIAELVRQQKTVAATMSEFGAAFRNATGGTNTSAIVATQNPLGGVNRVVWYMSPYYRAGWFYTDRGSVIRDMRVYIDSKEEPCLKTACNQLNFAFTDSKTLDEVTFGDRWMIDEGQLSDVSVTPQGGGVTIRYKNQAGTAREIRFSERDVSVDGKSQAVAEAIIAAVDANQQYKEKIQPTSVPFAFPWFGLLKGTIVFAAFAVVCLYLPGVWLRRMLGVRPLDQTGVRPLDHYQFALDLTVGTVFLTTLAYIFGLLNLGLGYLIVVVPISFWVAKGYRFRKPVFANAGLVSGAAALIAIGTLFVSLSVIKSGLPFGYGLGFWGPNGHDAIWHLALIEQLKGGVPPENPVYAGTMLTNYHYFFDLFVAHAALITRLPSLDLLLRFVPVLIAVLYGCLTFSLTMRLTKLPLAAFVATFLAYFGSSFGWLVTWARNGTVGGETMFWAMQAGSFLLNPPFAISVVILLAGTLYLTKWFAEPNTKLLLLLVVLFGTLSMFKVYAAILVLGSLGLVAVYRAVTAKEYQTFGLVLAIGLLTGVLLLPNTDFSKSLVLFSPLWLVNTMIESPDRVYWPRLVVTRESGSLVKFIGAETIGTLVFIFGNLGVRALAFGSIIAACKYNAQRSIYLFLLGIAVLGGVFSLTLIQKVASWNTVQFFYYTIIISNILAGVTIGLIATKFRSRVAQIIMVGIVVVCTLPANKEFLATYLPNRAPARLPNEELAALNFLKKQPHGVVLTYPYSDKLTNTFDAPMPLFAYTTTAYVSAFSGKPAYFEDRMNVELIGIDPRERIVGQQEIFKNTDPQFVQNFFAKNAIRYIYLPRYLKPHLDEGAYGIAKIYETNDVIIYKVQ